MAWAIDARPISARLETLCGLGAKSTVTPSPVRRQRERGRLPRLAHELLEQRPREVAQVETCECGVAEVHEAQAELPALRAALALHEAGVEQRREHARDGARVDLRAPGELVRAERAGGGGERLEHCDGAFDRAELTAHGDRPGGRSTLSTPPSITTVVPVTKSPAGEARNAIVCATSAAVPSRPSGIVTATSSTESP